MVRKLLIGVALLVVALIGVVVVRALMFGPTTPQPEAIPVAQIEVDLDAAAARLGQAVRYPTVSLTGAESDDRAAFDAMHRWMAETYPAFHAVAQRETVSELSLVYTWEGSDPSLQPILLLAHQDVVPVADDTRSAWTADPFGGEVRDGAVWGRGTLDDKGSMVALLEAAEYLAARGVRPTRTIILAFGHDEEIGGGEGAARIAALLAERGVRAWFVLDEGGGAIAENPLTGRPAAMIGITERGSGTMTVRAVGQPGHSSLPPEDTAVSLVSRAVVRIHGMSLERNFASGPVMEMMHALSPDLSFPAKAAFANEWLSGPLLHAEAGKTAPGRALMGTTIAPTMIDGGVRANVLPAEATATLNFRIHPRDNADNLLRRAREAVSDLEGVTVEWASPPRNASAVSSTTSSGYAVVGGLSRGVLPDARVAPVLVLAGTDSRHYVDVAEDVYRYAPMLATLDDARRAHGVDERMTLENYERMIRFYVALMQAGAAPD